MIDLESSYRYCAQVVESHYENFPVASRLLPARMRPSIAAIYAFARAGDDFSDEEPDTGRALELLSGWRTLLYQAAEGPVDHPVFRALSDVISRTQIPVQWLDNLLMAFERDRVIVRHRSFEDLLTYSRLSANPVGRLLLWIHGIRSEALFARSDATCTALQLANFWQDVSVDWQKGRVYIPQEELEIAGVPESALADPKNTPEDRAREQILKNRLFAFTAGLFSTGIPLPAAVGGRVGLELSLVWKGGVTILRKGWDPHRRLQERPVLTKGVWFKALFLPISRASLETTFSLLPDRPAMEKLFERGRAVYEERTSGPS